MSSTENESSKTQDQAAASQGMPGALWFTPENAELARATNDTVCAIATRELEAHLSVTDFNRLLAEAARRAERDAHRGA